MRTLPTPDTLLGGLTIEAFLEEYWQKKPLLIRGAFPDFQSPISRDDILQISQRDDAEARLILEKGGDYPWQLLYGPFEEDLSELPESHWTILVQEMNRFVPEIAELLNHFRFIPSWRIDDIMVSYAPAEGGVGAHIDNYDVFLLQAMGHRRWQIMNDPIHEESLVPDLDIRMLENFKAEEDWVLGPGDMLYLPPRIAHNGIAMDNCMTYSVGFRAPSHTEILSGFLGYLAEHTDPGQWYADPQLTIQKHVSEISPAALKQIASVIKDAVQDTQLIHSWFGSYVTESHREVYAYPLDEPVQPEQIRVYLEDGNVLTRLAGANFAFIRNEENEAELFANGISFLLPPPIAGCAPIICESPQLSATDLRSYIDNELLISLLVDLINEGLLERN